MTVTVGELRGLLADYDEDMEVRIASQPAWPFEHEVDQAVVAGVAEMYECDERTGNENVPVGEVTEIVYLVAGRQIGYLPPRAREAAGWR